MTALSDHERLHHDPRTKLQIKEALFDFLYAPVKLQFKQRLDALIVKNTLLGGYSHKSFMHKNVLYNCDTAPLPRKMNRLVPALTNDMADYLRDAKQLDEKEIPYVIGYINQVLNSSNDLCDYYRLLPESVHAPLQQLINTCPCKARRLSDEVVALLQDKNQHTIDLMRQRMVINLIS